MANHLAVEQDIRISYSPMNKDVVFEHDVKVRMRDGVHLSINVFRPRKQGRFPVVMAVSPYGKDQFQQNELFRNVPGAHLGQIDISDHTAFEAPDPNYWVSHGYVVIQGDVRGQGQSEGDTGPFHPQDRLDYYDLIEWAAVQPWSSGRIGLNGVSYLCISQWGVAALHPPHLSAVVLWEGWNDYYRRFYKGGIPETTFMWWLWDAWVKGNHNPASGFAEPDYLANAVAHPLLDDYWKTFETDLAKVEVPALICASFSDQGLHTRDTFEGFKKIGSQEKWLINHRRPKWHAYYDKNGLDTQRRFLDYYLKDQGAGLADQPPVTLEINRSRSDFETITRAAWPPEDTVASRFYLELESAKLVTAPPVAATQRSYESRSGTGLRLDYKIDKHLVIVGTAKLRLWVSADAADDLDLFVGLEKLDADGDRVFFYGFGGTNPNDIVTRGWLRASHRELDENASTELQPVHKHQHPLKLSPSETVPVEIELLPSGTIFEPGETLSLVIQGTPIQDDAGLLGYANLINNGRHHVHSGGLFDSYLVLPLLGETIV